MSTIDELLRGDAEIAKAESEALAALADYLRDSAVSLPDGSKLARIFARHSVKFDLWARDRARPSSNVEWADLEFDSVHRDIVEDES